MELANHNIASNTTNSLEGNQTVQTDEEYARRLEQELSQEDSNEREDDDLRLAREIQRLEEMEARRQDDNIHPPAISPVNPAAMEVDDEDEDEKLARAMQAEETLAFNEARRLQMEMDGGVEAAGNAQTPEDIQRDQEAAMALQRQDIVQDNENRGYWCVPVLYFCPALIAY